MFVNCLHFEEKCQCLHKNYPYSQGTCSNQPRWQLSIIAQVSNIAHGLSYNNTVPVYVLQKLWIP